jgi:hypothetical protein
MSDDKPLVNSIFSVESPDCASEVLLRSHVYISFTVFYEYNFVVHSFPNYNPINLEKESE